MVSVSRWVFKKHSLVLFTIATIICSFNGIVIAHAEIGDILTDGEIKEIASGDSLDLREGYRLTITIESDGAVFLLLKDGLNVKREKVRTGDNFYYFKKINFDNYKLIGIPYFTFKNNKIQFRLYQYSERMETETVKSYTPEVSNKQLDASDILKKAKEYGVLLDGGISIMDSVSHGNGIYYVVGYSNLLPYVEGVEVLSSDGKKISDESEVEQIFTSLAWKEATSQLKDSDMQTLNNILMASKNIEQTVSAAELDNDSTVGLINDEMNLWKNAALSVVTNLSDAIPSIEQVRNGGVMNPEFQNKISPMISDFEILQSRTIQMNERLISVNSILNAGRGGQDTAKKQVLGNLPEPFADALGGKTRDVDSMKVKADLLSRGIGEQSAKLSTIKNAAAKRKSELKGMWSARQTAKRKVYGTLVGAGTLVLMTAIIIIGMKKLNPAKNKN